MISQEQIKALQEGEKRGRKYYFLLTDVENNKVGDIRAVTLTTAKLWRDEANVSKGLPNRNAELYTEIDKSQINSRELESVIEKLKSISKSISIGDMVAAGLNKPGGAPAVKKTRTATPKTEADADHQSNLETN